MDAGDGRNQALFNYILTLTANDFTVEETRECIRILNKFVLKQPLSDDELEVILRDDAFQKPVFFLGSTFLFDKFANYMINNHHIVKINGQLHIYKDGIYCSDMNVIAGVMRSYIPNIKKSQKTEVIDYMYDMTEEKEQSDANLIAFNNGVYDLVTGELKPFSTDIVITNKIPWDYKPDAYSELADSTLNKLACGDAAIRALLEECIGYCFYRSNTFNKAFILTGDKSNGKSTFLKVLTVLLGEQNVASLDLKNLGDKFSKATLFGKLANIGDDISDEFVPDASLFKKITDGGRIQVEKKGQDPFEFNPYVKLIFSANNMPRIKDKTGAVLRRLVIIPFNARFSESDADYKNSMNHRDFIVANQLNKQMKLSGASTEEASSAMLQLTQSLAKGTLNGDELTSVMENGSMVIQTIADYMGVTQGEIKDLAADGQVTSDIIIAAMLGAADETNAAFATLPLTWSDIWQNIKNAALVAFQPVLQRINDFANSTVVQNFANGVIEAMAVISNVVLNIFDLIGTVGGFIADNWSIISPIIYGVIGALAVYAAYLGIVKAIELASAAASMIHSVAMSAKIGVMAALTGQTMAATDAQMGYNGALYASVTWSFAMMQS